VAYQKAHSKFHLKAFLTRKLSMQGRQVGEGIFLMPHFFHLLGILLIGLDYANEVDYGHS
jgi:hypothetical protein